MENTSNTESPDTEENPPSSLPAMTCDDQRSAFERRAQATPKDSSRCPPHHWILSSPSYSKTAIEETTRQVCRKCGKKNTHVFDIPYAERSILCREETFGQR